MQVTCSVDAAMARNVTEQLESETFEAMRLVKDKCPMLKLCSSFGESRSGDRSQ